MPGTEPRQRGPGRRLTDVALATGRAPRECGVSRTQVLPGGPRGVTVSSVTNGPKATKATLRGNTRVKLKQTKNAGFTLIELMIVVAIIAIIASVAIPKLLSARVSANESAAISTLRSISSAQAQLQSSAAIDTDNDGGGEYGYFAELAGTVGLRQDDGAGAVEIGATLVPPMLSGALGIVDADGYVQRSGYMFAMYLPDDVNAGILENAAGGADVAAAPDPDQAEVLWACYAWPLDYQQTGNRVFFINQDGDILQSNNRDALYSGADTAPEFDAAFSVDDDMSSPTANSAAGIDAIDEGVWTVLQ
jgi:prepilin-type N-terminal cleavage/methylation domain-containing protein